MMRSHSRERHWIDIVGHLAYSTLFFVWIASMFVFGSVYFFLSYLPGQGPTNIDQMSPLLRFMNSIYFSVITGTSTGYGDITPLGISKLFAAIQSVFSLSVFAAFVTRFVSSRQDATIQQMQTLVAENSFHKVREGFFIVRKDLDKSIIELDETNTLAERTWTNLTSAYLHAQSLLEEIPNFYHHVYNINAKRERLLLESVERTISRTVSLLETLGTKGIDWRAHAESASELSELCGVLEWILSSWSTSAHAQNTSHIRHTILPLKERLCSLVSNTP